MMYERYQPPMMTESFQAPQRRRNVLQEQIQQTLSDRMLAESLLDRSRPLPDWMMQNIEGCLNEYKKVLLGAFDAYYGLDGGMPQVRRRW